MEPPGSFWEKGFLGFLEAQDFPVENYRLPLAKVKIRCWKKPVEFKGEELQELKELTEDCF